MAVDQVGVHRVRSRLVGTRHVALNHMALSRGKTKHVRQGAINGSAVGRVPRHGVGGSRLVVATTNVVRPLQLQHGQPRCVQTQPSEMCFVLIRNLRCCHSGHDRPAAVHGPMIHPMLRAGNVTEGKQVENVTVRHRTNVRPGTVHGPDAQHFKPTPHRDVAVK